MAYEKGDFPTALEIFKPLAEQGQVKAQFSLARMYTEGKGIDINSVAALHWYGLAADEGEPNAKNNLGWMYQKGEGIPQDYNAAMKWYQHAADQGFTTAQNNIGFLMYFEGHGIPQNYVRAHLWPNIASMDNANTNSGKYRDIVNAICLEHISIKRIPVLLKSPC